MNERNLKAQLAAAKKRITELERELANLSQNKTPVSESNIVWTAVTATAPEPETKPYDPMDPCPNDPVFNMLRAQHPYNRERRSWLNIT